MIKEYRCPNDGKLLFRGMLIDSDIEIKCRACKEVVVIHGEPVSAFVCKKIDCENRVQ